MFPVRVESREVSGCFFVVAIHYTPTLLGLGRVNYVQFCPVGVFPETSRSLQSSKHEWAIFPVMWQPVRKIQFQHHFMNMFCNFRKLTMCVPRKVLHGLSIELQPGKTTALVGASGSGKSTSVKLGSRQSPTFNEILGGSSLQCLEIDAVN